MPPVHPVADAADPRLEPYRDIRERDLARRDGLFVLEGEVVLRLAAREGRFAIASVLVTANRLGPLEDVLEQLPATTPVYVVDQSLMDGIAGFEVHRGVLAAGVRPAFEREDVLAGLPPQALVVAGIGIANHDNIGGLFRNAAAFGVSAVLLDGTSCDPLYRKAIRVSVGAALTVPFRRGGDALDLVGRLSREGFDLLALSPAGTHAIGDVPLGTRSALLLGAEGPGLPEAILARATPVRIPMAGKIDSLNLATAAGIALARLHERRSGN
jgi:tRNA G18 (ribose-2'-O)-methylase SpoU